jgi:NADH dehydrogenase FAD-containing subunit
MAGIASIGGSAGTSGVQFEAELQTRVMKLQKDAVDMQGDMALKLLESAAGATSTGQQLNIQV